MKERGGSAESETGSSPPNEQQRARTTSADMPNFAGIWKMRSSENFDELLKALGKSLSPPVILTLSRSLLSLSLVFLIRLLSSPLSIAGGNGASLRGVNYQSHPRKKRKDPKKKIAFSL